MELLTSYPHLKLKQLRPSEGRELFLLVDRNRESLREWLPWLDQNRKVLDSENFIINISKSNGNGSTLILGVYFHEKLVGLVSFVSIHPVNRLATVGYWLCASVRGRGLMSSAVARLIDYGFDRLHLHRIEIHAAPDNVSSRRIPERLGFQQEGVMRQAGFLYGNFVDLVLYSLLRSEWKGLPLHSVALPQAK